MRKIIYLFISLILSNSSASAEGCPDFFRFVDFGLETPDGALRGGPTYRAEGFDGRALLIRELTVCSDVRDLASDGHGNPIPIVTSINYDPDITGLDLKELRLTVSEDITSEAEQNAAEHRTNLASQSAIIMRGSHYLCASLEIPDGISCQFISPVGGNIALVVYCDPFECRIPMLALNEKVSAVVTWLPSEASQMDHETAILEMAEKVQQAHDFLAPLSSWKPNFTRLNP